jgi:dTDP-4-amino-4,6-dideoxygalactose transaminase
MGESADEHFPTYKVSSFRKALGHAFFYHLDSEVAKQREKADLYFEKMKDVFGIRLVMEREKTTATYPYVTLIVDLAEKRDEILKKLNLKGLGTSIVYVSALQDYDFLRAIVPDRGSSNARYLAQHMLTLSTSTFLSREDILVIARVIGSS